MKIQLKDVTAIVATEQPTEIIENICKRCVFKEMGKNCPQGLKLPLCFAQENKFHKPLYFKLKKDETL